MDWDGRPEKRMRACADDAVGPGIAAPPPQIGGDERRMHMRAYNHWLALLHGRACPAIADLDPEAVADFAPHSVVLDFSTDRENPSIRYLGAALRQECGMAASIARIADVPAGSLLSLLTCNFSRIIAHRAPIGFEAEFINARGNATLYRGILMPFSSDGATTDFLHGVINWRELADSGTQARLAAELAEARLAQPARIAHALRGETPCGRQATHA
jgi:hypothetical protein